MTLSSTMQEWIEWDQAAYLLGLSIGAITDEIPFSKRKSIFWTDNPAGRGLHSALLTLTEAGLLESRNDDEEFRWATPKFINIFE